MNSHILILYARSLRCRQFSLKRSIFDFELLDALSKPFEFLSRPPQPAVHFVGAGANCRAEATCRPDDGQAQGFPTLYGSHATPQVPSDFLPPT